MGYNNVQERLRKKLALRQQEIMSGPIGRAAIASQNDPLLDICTQDFHQHPHVQEREAMFDVTPENLPWLGDAIMRCIFENISLKPYSSLTFQHPTVPLTEIPGLSILFQKACVHYGLLGYLDWVNENNPSEQNTIITNNIIIITCGTVVFNSSTDVIDPEKDNTQEESLHLTSSATPSIPEVVHDINQRKLEHLRKLSRQKFDSMLAGEP
jgi:hypothetical protein